MQDCKVAVKVCKEYDESVVFSALKQGIDILGGIERFIKPGMKVMIKPDLYLETIPDHAKTTHPSIVSALADIIDKVGAKCIIADSPKSEFKQSKLDSVYSKTKMLEVSNNGHALLSSNDKICLRQNNNGEKSREIYLVDAINDVDVIVNVGKFRCDKYLGLIGCSQNTFGLVPGRFKDLVKSRCYELGAYYNYLIDLNELLEDKLVLNVLDGIVSSETNGDPRILNAIIIGENPYAVDATALKLINQNIEDCLLIKESERRKKFKFDFEIVGDNIEPLICADYNYFVLSKYITKGSNRYFKNKYKSHQKRPLISTTQCKGCRKCSINCPIQAIEMQNCDMGEYAVIDYNKCVNCLKCVENCPYKVVTIKTPVKYKSIEKKIKECLKNK